MNDCHFGVSPVNYPDPDPDPEEILKNQADGCLKINGTQKVKMPCENKNIFS